MGWKDKQRAELIGKYLRQNNVTPLLNTPPMDAGQELRYNQALQAQQMNSPNSFAQGLLGMVPVLGDAVGAYQAVTAPRTQYKSSAKTETGKTIGGLLDKADIGMRGMALAAPGLLGLGALHAMAGPKQNLSPLAKMYGNQMGAIVYHGTPHKFAPEPDAPLGKFRLDKIGTGEGAQAYGHGIYVAESPDVANQYRVNLSYNPEEMKIGGSQINDYYTKLENQAATLPPQQSAPLYDRLSVVERLMSNERIDEVAKYANEVGQGDWFNSEVAPKFQSFGAMYHADLPDEHIANMLDWDKPLSEQSPEVQQAFLKAQADGDPILSELLDFSPGGMQAQGMVPNARGAAAYKTMAEMMGGQEKASTKLSKAGIPGIKYLDQGSRGKGDGTRNYVVFNPELLKILKRE